MATKESESMRIRTGYERVLPHLVSELYAISAKQDGTVIEINEKTNMFKVQYADGSIYTYKYGEEYGLCSDIVTTQKKELTIKVGDTFKRGDVLCYNPQFFEKDPYSRQVDWKHGCVENIALMEIPNTYEDSNIITKELGEKLGIEPVQVRTLVLDKNTYIHKCLPVGSEVGINDFLMVFENADTATMIEDTYEDESEIDEITKYLSKLERSTPKAKFAGTIVKIEAYYSCPLNDMHPTLSKTVKNIIKPELEKHRYAEDTQSSVIYPESKPLPKGIRFKGIRFDETTVLIRFFIKENISAGVGDKVVFGPSLKSVISSVSDEPIYSEQGKKISAIFSCTSISNRIVNSSQIVGIANTVLEDIENEVISIWNS